MENNAPIREVSRAIGPTMVMSRWGSQRSARNIAILIANSAERKLRDYGNGKVQEEVVDEDRAGRLAGLVFRKDLRSMLDYLMMTERIVMSRRDLVDVGGRYNVGVL